MNTGNAMKMASVGALACAMLALPVARGAEPRADLLPETLKACISLKLDAERLMCYDRAIASLRSGDPAIAAPSAENMFGASPQTAASQPVEREELRQITAQIASLRQSKEGGLVLGLDNGQTWRQQDIEAVLSLKNGDSVTITRASLGTFRITDTRGRSARFKRLR